MTVCAITCPECGHQIKPLPKEVLRWGPLVMRVDTCLLKIGDGEPERLPPKEGMLLAELIRHHDRACSYDQLATACNVWESSPKIISVYIWRLRKHLAGSGVNIATLHSGGYMLTMRDVEPFRRRSPATEEQMQKAVALVRNGLNLAEAGRSADLSVRVVRRVATRAGVWPRQQL